VSTVTTATTVTTERTPGSAHATGADPAVRVAHVGENIVVGDEIVRYKVATRVIHWVTAGTFILCLITGMPIWSPIFGWMGELVGGLHVCRWLHPWAGVAFAASMLVMFVHWWREMLLDESDRGWFGKRVIRYMRYQDDDPNVGKFNGGQKLFFWAVSLGAVAVLLSGLVLWFPEWFPQWLRETSILLHEVVFILYAVAIVFHVYLGGPAEPGTFRAMTRGTVTKPWARLHHPRWYREVTGDDSRPR
jgi:formate dehydrogenase subunit gamma